MRARVTQIKQGYESRPRLSREDVRFLRSVNAGHGVAHQEANWLLAEHYRRAEQWRLQIEALEVVTSRGRYKQDGRVWLALAQARGKLRQYRSAIEALRWAERKSRRMNRRMKQSLYQTYGEYLRYQYQALERRNEANPALLSDGIRKWEKFKLNGGDPSLADRKIEELRGMER